jgi:hypothetical protein
MVTSDGRVKIADFGIAKATKDMQTGAFLTATGTTVGTPTYMAPEQAMAQDIGPWTDLYSVGCMAFEMFTGKVPFHDSDAPMAILLRHVNEPIPAVTTIDSSIDDGISDWVEKLLVKDPKERTQSANEAWDEFEELIISLLGPRWRREARLFARAEQVDTPKPLTPAPFEGAPEEVAPPSDEFQSFSWEPAVADPDAPPGPATPPPAEPSRPVEGIDLEGTGPDTPRPAARPPVLPLARYGALALLAALLIPLLASDADRWNVFAVLSPFEAIGVAYLVIRSRNPGVLVGAGALMTVAALGLIKFTAQRVDALAVVLAVIVLGGALAILAAGLRERIPAAVTPADPGTLLLGLAGVALAVAALFVNYDGFSSLWSEVGEGDSAEFFFEPMVGAVAGLAGLVFLGTMPRFAAGLLLAVGTALSLHHLGLVVAAWRAIGEVGEVKAAGFLGILGGLLILAAGAYAHRS